MEDMERQLDKGSANPPLRKEIVMVNDLILRNAWHAVQTSGLYMTLSVVVKVHSGSISLVSQTVGKGTLLALLCSQTRFS